MSGNESVGEEQRGKWGGRVSLFSASPSVAFVPRLEALLVESRLDNAVGVGST